jgi:hypothetical protein
MPAIVKWLRGSSFHGLPGSLYYHPARVVGYRIFPAYVEGTMSSYFSDRRFEPQNNQGIPWAPFNPNNVDTVTIRIFLTSGLGTNSGLVQVVLNSWGDTLLSFQGSCQNGLLTGYLQSPPTNVGRSS